ncbi:MAG: hypothetical protein DHS20C21_13840 [Gemmatimonadota bacterium]|nr:MAG: hypothetical protein DHS20C21_13840 [Gemmatimonadota bacterium]
MKRVLAPIALMVVTAAATATHASTFRVPEEYATIQAAIDVAASGDSVLVGPGTWTPETRSIVICSNLVTSTSVMFLKPGITVIGTAGPEATILDGGSPSPNSVNTLIMESVEGDPVRVEGFTITGEDEGLVWGCSGTHLELVNCHLVDNGDIAIVSRDGRVFLTDCVVSGNGWIQDSGSPQHAVFLGDGGRFEATGTRFEGNVHGAISASNITALIIDDCQFVDHAERGAIGAGGVALVSVKNSLFLRNRVRGSGIWGGAVGIGQALNATVEFCTFAYDSALAGQVGGLFLGPDVTATVRNNTFYRCFTPFRGGAIGVSGIATVSGNVAVECEGAAFAAYSGSNIEVGSGCNILWNETNYHQWPPEAMASDVIGDPQFCAPDLEDFTVRDSSPASEVNSGGCGQIGAHGVGCGSVSITPSTWGSIKSRFRGTVESR